MSGITRILTLVDTAEEQQPVLDSAANLARQFNAHLTVVDVVPEFNWPQRVLLPDHRHLKQLLTREKRQRLKTIAKHLEGQGTSVDADVLNGKTSIELTKAVVRDGFDLVVKAAKGRRSRRTSWLGTTAQELLRKCPCPVLLIQPGKEAPFRKVVAAVDATPNDADHAELNEKLLRLARQLCTPDGGHLDVVHAWSIYGERLVKDYMKPGEFEQLEHDVREESWANLLALAEKIELPATPEHLHLLRGEPTVEIPRYATDHQAGLLVMGTVARRGAAGLFIGNTAEIILGELNCSILAVKPDHFVSPVKVRARRVTAAKGPANEPAPEMPVSEVSPPASGDRASGDDVSGDDASGESQTP